MLHNVCQQKPGTQKHYVNQSLCPARSHVVGNVVACVVIYVILMHAAFACVKWQTVGKSPVCVNQAGKYMMTDPIADMLTRIRNAQAAKKRDVVVPFSKVKFGIAELLRDEGYVDHVEKVEDKFGSIRIRLKYENGKPYIREIDRVSRPGYRRYVKKDDIPVIANGFGVAILSTSIGLMTNKKAKQMNTGGEIICKVL